MDGRHRQHVSGAGRQLRVQSGHDGAAKHAGDDSAGADLQGQRGRAHREHVVRDFQLARHSDRRRHCVAGRRRRVCVGRHCGVCRHGRRDRHGSLMEDAAERDAQLDAAMTTQTSIRARLRRLAVGERGTTLIETAIASGILLVTLAGLLSMGTIATMHTENQGHLAPRTTEYAQDKMEQLLGLAYSDAVADTIPFPAIFVGGSGLAVGGNNDPAAPVNKYVDWLSADGSLLGGGTAAPDDEVAGHWFYERVWKVTCITNPPTPCNTDPATGIDRGIKQIDITVRVRTGVANFLPAKSTVTALKAAQF